MTYQPLDIERSPGEQDVELGAYDVVIAANVLHATADVEQALAHVRSLLTPNGRLVLLEGTRPLLWLDLIFGMTAGWWKRDTHPLMSIQQWQRSLEGVRFECSCSVVSAQGDALPQSVLVASAASSEPLQQTLTEQSLVVSAPGMTCADLLSHHFSSQQIKGTQLVQLEASDSQFDTIENSLSSVLELIQGLAKQDGELPQLLLLTQGATDGAALEQSPLWGLMRVVALEFPALNCCRLDLAPQAAAEEQMGHICQELKAVQANHQKQQLRETIRYRAGKRQVARLAGLPQVGEAKNLSVPAGSFKLSLLQKGSPDNLRLTSAERLDSTLLMCWIRWGCCPLSETGSGWNVPEKWSQWATGLISLPWVMR
mgnify:CR=1 FL=1